MTIPLAILGLGTWGQRLVAAVNAGPRPSGLVRFTHAGLRDSAKYASVLRDHGLAYCAFEDLLGGDDVEAVVIATPHSQHFAQCRQALLAGKHVFCEKPLAMTSGQTQELYELADHLGLVLAVGFNRRFLPAIAHLKRMIDEGVLGTVINVEGNFSGAFGLSYTSDAWRASDADAPAGGLTAMGIHVIDIFVHLLGPIESVQAQAFRRVEGVQIHDTVNVVVRFASGLPGYLTTMMATPWIWRLQIFGTEAWAQMRSDRALEVQRVVEADDRYLDRVPEVISFPPCNTEREELEAFGRALRGGERFPVEAHQVTNGAFVMDSVIGAIRQDKSNERSGRGQSR